jgi:hypothetical protein
MYFFPFLHNEVFRTEMGHASDLPHCFRLMELTFVITFKKLVPLHSPSGAQNPSGLAISRAA